MRIVEVVIGNFKAFAEPQTVRVCPLTLIYGANGCGKSSVLHAVAFLKKLLETGEVDAANVDPGGDGLQLGRFREFRH